MKTHLITGNKLLLSLIFVFVMCHCAKDGAHPGEEKPTPDAKFEPVEVADYWWPAQKSPQSYTILTHNNSIQEQMLAQSVVGVAAQCVNRGISSEMMWEYTRNPLQKTALQEISSRLQIQRRGTANVWDITKRLYQEGVVKGYILYSIPPKACDNHFDDGNESVNAATMLAGLNRAVLIEKSIERYALEIGLPKLADATSTTPLEVFRQNKHLLNNKFTYMSDPAYTAGKDLVIAQCATMVHHPKQAYTQEIIKWLEPLAPVIGVTCADEAETVRLSTEYSHFHIGLDHTNNFTFLSIEAFDAPIDKMQPFDPKSVDLTSNDTYHSVFISDGDNLGWIHDYLSDDQGGWLNPATASTSLSWTFTPVNMSAASPSGWNYYVETKPDNCSLIEYGMYMYPDLFATGMPAGQREELLRALARKIGAQMKKTGANILSFICIDSHSPKTLEAYSIFAQEIDCLIGCISIQYFPYPDGRGEIDWVQKKDGTEIPVIRPKYCIVGGNQGEYSAYQGTPSEIFLKVNNDANKLTSTVYHAWSAFTQLPDGHLGPDATPPALGTMNAVDWAKRLLDADAHLVSYEELIWRIRMKYKPEQTKELLGI